MNQRIELLGLPLDTLTMEQSVQRCDELIASKGPHQHVVINAAKVVAAFDDPELARIIKNCSLVNADGQSVVWAGRVLGQRIPERVAGIDLMFALWELAARRDYSVYLLGAQETVVLKVAREMEGRGIRVAGRRNGFWEPGEESTVVSHIASSGADILFVAIPSPRKEKFLDQHLSELGVPLAFGVGGSFDIVAGVTKRAPAWMQHGGLEWFYRFCQEPRRMFRRYLVGNSRFLLLVLRARLKDFSN